MVFLPNLPEADKSLRLPCEMRSLFLRGSVQKIILEILNICLPFPLRPACPVAPEDGTRVKFEISTAKRISPGQVRQIVLGWLKFSSSLILTKNPGFRSGTI
jgi:hypothetical protein